VCHSHPFPGRVRPSPIDLATETEFCGRVAPLRLGDRRPVGALIIGPDGASARVWIGGESTPADVRVIGDRVRVLTAVGHARVSTLAPYARQLLLWGAEGQAILNRSTVAVVGLGGTGSHVAQQLAYLGLGRLV